jgi:hypothetical protein
MKGIDPNLVQAIAVGEPALRAQAVLSNLVQSCLVSPPHDVMLQQQGLKAVSGPPEIGVPSSGLFASDKLIKRKLRRYFGAPSEPRSERNKFIDANREETIRIMAKAVPQSLEAAARSYDIELKQLARNGLMTDSEIEFQMDRLAEKRRPLDEVRDFSFARQALKELESGK